MLKKLLISAGVVCILAAVWLTFVAEPDVAGENLAAQSGPVFEQDYSPTFGPSDARVTIVEFFDPACEACRAFYPFVKEILERHPKDVRLVLRYAAFHDGSEIVIRMLEAARRQEVFKPVLETLLARQEEWASHHQPNIARAWDLAVEAGLDLEKTRSQMNSAEFDELIRLENEAIRQLQVSKTPTFYVNQKPLATFGSRELYRMVVQELDSTTPKNSN